MSKPNNLIPKPANLLTLKPTNSLIPNPKPKPKPLTPTMATKPIHQIPKPLALPPKPVIHIPLPPKPTLAKPKVLVPIPKAPLPKSSIVMAKTPFPETTNISPPKTPIMNIVPRPVIPRPSSNMIPRPTVLQSKVTFPVIPPLRTNTQCVYQIPHGSNKGEYCGVITNIHTNYCQFHTSINNIDKTGNNYESWVHQIKPKQEHSIYSYEQFPKEQYDEYADWVEYETETETADY